MSSSFLFSTNHGLAGNLKHFVLNSDRTLKLETLTHKYFAVEFFKQKQKSVSARKYPIYYSGTLIYKGKKNDDALDSVYEDFDCELCSLPEHIYGMYAITVIKNNKLFCFVDESCLYKLYYTFSDHDLTIFNSFYVLAKVLKYKKINPVVLIEKCFQFSTLTNETIFEDIYRVLGDQILVYDFKEKRYCLQTRHREKIHNLKALSFDAYSTQLADLILKQGKRIKNLYNNVSINMTGGLDSRMILGAALSNNISPKLLYGKGNSFLTNTKDEDAAIVEAIANRYSLHYAFMDWSTTDEDILNSLHKYWEYFIIYGCNSKILNFYSQILPLSNDFVEFGYFGEPFRNMNYFEGISADTRFTFDQIVSNYLYYDWRTFLVSINIYDDWCSKMKDFLKDKISSDETLSSKQFSSLVIRYRKDADTMMHNFINHYMDGFSIMGDSEILDLNEVVPLHYKDKTRFMISVLLNVNKTILDYPVFSHCQLWKYNKKKKELVETLYQKAKKLAAKYSQCIGMKEFVRSLYYFLSPQTKGDREALSINRSKIIYDIKNLQKVLGLELIYPEKFTGDYRCLYDYYLYLILIHDIINN